MARGDKTAGREESPLGEVQVPGEIKVQLPPQVAAGVYANGMLVQHTNDEFVMDFTMVVGNTGTVVSRVITSPGHMKRVVAALEENLRCYEAMHGTVSDEQTEQPRMRVGFQPPAEEGCLPD